MKSFCIVVLLLAILVAGYTTIRVKVYACAPPMSTKTHNTDAMNKSGGTYCWNES